MSKTSTQALELSPSNELQFNGPFTEVSAAFITLTNQSDNIVYFKVKTTAPRTYVVRPNGGCILPMKTVKVSVTLHPFGFDLEERKRDKFMVQSIFAPETFFDLEHASTIDKAWEQALPDQLMNSKLKCVFVESSQDTAANPAKVEEEKNKSSQSVESKFEDPEKDLRVSNEALASLKAELNELRQENYSLKEEGLRSRVVQDARSRPSASAKPQDSQTPRHIGKPAEISTYTYIAAAIIFLLGLFIGKLVL